MPLLKGSSKETVSKNIKKMVEEGYPSKVAVAASLSSARGGKKRPPKKSESKK